ncbi:hypothetical protein EV363DRAFT_1535916 [Boletus edulis]|nr:hypothetical protein EV363DRAFT_1535916 [Boletus edulis]
MVEPFSRSIRSQKGKPLVSETPVKDNRDLGKQLPPSSTAFPSLTNRPVEPTPSGVGERIYGGTAQDAGDEVRFSIELTRIDRLKDTYSLDIRRLKGNLRSYKFLHDTIRERADLQSEVQEPSILGRYALPSRVLGGHGHARNYLHTLTIFCSLSSLPHFSPSRFSVNYCSDWFDVFSVCRLPIQHSDFTFRFHSCTNYTTKISISMLYVCIVVSSLGLVFTRRE